MRKIGVFIIQLVVFVQVVFCQDVVIYSNDYAELEIDKHKKEYSIWHNTFDDLIEPPSISKGKMSFNQNSFTCIDTKSKEKIIFKQIDKYRLLVTNNNRFLKMKQRFYAIKISNSQGEVLQFMNWKNGKPHGYWTYYSSKGVTFVLYNKGNIIEKKFKTNEELYDELMKSPAEL